MLKILIADNEINNLNNIKSYIDKNFHQFKVSKIVSLEKELYKFIKNNHIDIIIMEIKFFGIEFNKKIKEICDNNKLTKFIVYGNISSLDYLKKALEIGAINYAIRPLKPQDLERCLNTALNYFKSYETFKSEENILDIEYIQNFKLFEDKFLSLLINERIFDKDEIENSFKYFNIKISSPYTVAIIRIDNFKKIIMNKDQKEKHILIFKILKTISPKIENAKLFINLFNEIIVIFGAKQSLEDLISMLNEVKLTIKEKTSIDVSIGIGRTYKEPTKISTSFIEANNALRYRCIMGYNSIIALDYVEPENTFSANYPYTKEKNLVYAAVIGEYDYCINLLDQIFKEIKTFKSKFESILPQIVISILLSINRNAFEQDIKIEPVYQFFSTKDALNLKTTEEAYLFLKTGLKLFCEYICQFRKDKENELLEKIKIYLNENYYEDLNYKKIAFMLNSNYKYIKKLFENNIQKALPEYINKIRIEKAKNLILETNLTDDIIAIKLGYEDVTVFRKAFKKSEGILAGDFRYINKDLKR